MGMFRKKPVVIEAVQFHGVLTRDGKASFSEIPEWLSAAMAGGGNVWLALNDGPKLMIATLEGDHRADPGDWIIRGVKGELYPCKPDIFAATYESVSPAASLSPSLPTEAAHPSTGVEAAGNGEIS